MRFGSWLATASATLPSRDKPELGHLGLREYGTARGAPEGRAMVAHYQKFRRPDFSVRGGFRKPPHLPFPKKTTGMVRSIIFRSKANDQCWT